MDGEVGKALMTGHCPGPQQYTLRILFSTPFTPFYDQFKVAGLCRFRLEINLLQTLSDCYKGTFTGCGRGGYYQSHGGDHKISVATLTQASGAQCRLTVHNVALYR